MPLALDGALRVLATGGGLRIKSVDFLEKDLVTMAANAVAGGSQLIIKASWFMTADTMVRISESGKGHVIFDLSEQSQEEGHASSGSGYFWPMLAAAMSTAVCRSRADAFR